MIVCYGNQRSAGIASAVRCELKNKGLEEKFEIIDGGLPEYTKPTKPFVQDYLDAYDLFCPPAGEELRNRGRRAVNNSDLEGCDKVLVVDEYIGNYLRERFKVASEKVEPILKFVGSNRKDLDDAEVCLARKYAQYVKKRNIPEGETFQFVSLNGGKYLERSRAAYFALALDCVSLGQIIVSTLGDVEK